MVESNRVYPEIEARTASENGDRNVVDRNIRIMAEFQLAEAFNCSAADRTHWFASVASMLRYAATFESSVNPGQRY